MNVIGISGLHNSVQFRQKHFPNLSARQYRIVFGHDSAAALVSRKGILAAAAEERFSREKGTDAFPVNAISYCLNAANVHPKDVDIVAHGWSFEPHRRFHENRGDLGALQFEEVFSDNALVRWVDEYCPNSNWSEKVVHVPHHLAHAASAYYVSGLPESLIVVVDGMGEQHSTTIAVGQQGRIKIVRQVPGLHSLGILYGVFTLYLGFEFNSDEYKVMGLAPYGDPGRYGRKVQELIHFRDDGTFTSPILFHNYSQEEKETFSGTVEQLAEIFGPRREPEAEITKRHMDIAAGLQSAIEESLMRILRMFKAETGQVNLCMAGGVALNCTANGLVKRSRVFKNMFIQPASGDDGTALGAALFVQHEHESDLPVRKMALPLWGPSFESDEIRTVLDQRDDCDYRYFPSFADLASEIAPRIAEKQVVAWFQGRMEFGPRALGNRSILADPRDPQMRDRINALVKKREWFRPFAPAVTAEAARRFFKIDKDDEAAYSYMLLVTQVRDAYRALLPAITHVDGSARVQTVSEQENHRFWLLLNEFGRLTGLPLLLNTSFNVRGQPIVCTPTEALDTFILAKLDVLVIGDYVVVPKSVFKDTSVNAPNA